MPLRRLVVLVSAALVASSAGVLTPAGAQESAAADGSEATTLLVVRESGTTSQDIVDQLGEADIDVDGAENLAEVSTTQVEVDADDAGEAIDELRGADGVEAVYLDQTVSAFATVPNDPGFSSQWGTRSTNVDDVWPATTGAAETVIAVLDTGVNTVPDLAGRVLPGKDFVNNDMNAADDHGHGTQVATVAAAAGNDGQGIAGACWSCRILPVKVLAANGSGSLGNVANAIVWATDHGADIINLSLGGPTNIPLVDSAVSYATSRNVVIVAAAGNDSSPNPNYPAAVAGTIAVGANDPSKNLYSFSNYGAGWVDIAAPGCNTATGTGSATSFCGTSSATPLAAGIIGLLRSAYPGLSAANIRAAVENSTQPLAVGGVVARGMIDAGGALNAAYAAAGGTAPWIANLDSTPPTGVIADQGVYVSNHTTTWVDTSDNVGVVAVQLFVDGTLAGSAAPGSDGRAVITWFTGWRDGPVTLRASMSDAAGNLSSTPDRVVRVDNRAPVLGLSEPGNGAKVGNRFNVTVSSQDGNDVMLTLVAVGGKVVAGSRGNGTFRFNVAPPKSGRLQVVAAAVDYAGHISFSNVATVTAKVKAPARRR